MPGTRRLRLTIVDTLAFWDNYIETHVFNPEVKATSVYWFRVPEDWLQSGGLPADRLEVLLCHIYGPGWRGMNEDGSKYMVLSHEVAPLTPEDESSREWMGAARCNVVSADGVQSVKPEEF